MIDIQIIRDNPETVAEKAAQKGYEINVGQLLKIDTERKKMIAQIESLRACRIFKGR